MLTDLAAVQRRTLVVLAAVQIIGGVGSAIGLSVGALLVADLIGVGVSGLAQSAVLVGAALLAVPAAAIVQRRGRRPSLAASYFVAALGAALIVTGATRGATPLLFGGFMLFGGATAAGFQARYAAQDLAPPALRGRHLSLIVWATTIGAVAGPNLAAVAGAALRPYGIPTLAAPFVFSSLLLALAALVLALLLRPDPAGLAHLAQGGASGAPGRPGGLRAAWRAVLSRPTALLGMSAMAVGHLVMVGIMAMTPVHIRAAGHDATLTLRIVGIVISVHIAGMYALAPLMGWLTDRWGRRAVIALGIALLVSACAIAGTAQHAHVQLGAGLMVLGLGWSATLVAGSTWLSESVPAELRAAAQGLADLTMGLAGASAGALSGVVVGAWGYTVLTVLAAAATAPLALVILTAARHTSRPVAPVDV